MARLDFPTPTLEVFMGSYAPINQGYGSLYQSQPTAFFQDYRNETLSKFMMPTYHWGLTRTPYSPRADLVGAYRQANWKKLLETSSVKLRLIDEARVQEVDDVYKLCQMHRDQYRDHSGRLHPLRYFQDTDSRLNRPNLTRVMKEKVLITHAAIPQVALDVLKDKYELVVVKGLPNPTRDELLQLIQGCSAALWYGHQKVDREMVDTAGEQLKIVAHSGAGFDHMDVAYMRQKGILVTNAAGVLGPAVADTSIALLLSVARRTLEGYHAILEDKWLMNHPTWMVGQGISNKTVGIVGLGQNGFAIAKRILGFEIKRLLYNDLEELKEKEVVNQDDLVEALQKKMIWGAGLDVMYPEPLPHDHILTKLPNCVLTPHIGSRTFDTRIAMYVFAATNILNALSGQPVLTPVS